MKFWKLFFIPFWLIISYSTYAQNTSKSEKALYDLMDSGFLKAYKDYRYEVEKHVAIVKAKESDFRPEEIAEIKSTYIRTSEAFEDFIFSTRNDFLDKKTRRMIRKDTERYVTERLEKLNKVYVEYYLQKFLPVYTSINIDESNMVAEGGERATIPPEIPISLIIPVAKATMEVIEFLDSKNDKDLAYLKTLLDKEWVQPNRFRTWEEI